MKNEDGKTLNVFGFCIFFLLPGISFNDRTAAIAKPKDRMGTN